MKAAIMGLVTVALSASGAAWAATFDGKTALVCTVSELYECAPASGCGPVSAQDTDDVRHLKVDFKAKTVKLAHVDTAHTSQIDSVETVDGKLVLQGIEDGFADAPDGGGWTMAIDDTYGTLGITLARNAVVFAGFGGCTAAP